MKVKELKELTANLDGDTPVFVSSHTLEYTEQHPEQCGWAYHLIPSEQTLICPIPYSTVDVRANPPLLKELRALEDEAIVSIDIEDGHFFRDLEQVLIFPDRVILLPQYGAPK